jgi:hypothetical protein
LLQDEYCSLFRSDEVHIESLVYVYGEEILGESC